MNQDTVTQQRLLTGIPLSAGIGEGFVWHAIDEIPQQVRDKRYISESMIVGELGKMRQAIQLVSLVIENSIHQISHRLGKPYADMFVALREMLHDSAIINALVEQIELRHLDAASAVIVVLDSFRLRFSEIPIPYLRERGTDILELQHSLLDALASADTQSEKSTEASSCSTPESSCAIAVVETLTPRMVLDLKNTNVSGILCEFAGQTSHAAILCRAFGIPAITGITAIHSQIPLNWYARLDGKTGTVNISAQRRLTPDIHDQISNREAPLDSPLDLSQIVIMANLNLSQNAISALAVGAQGVGLYRTEFEFMLENRILTQEEQFARYRTVVTAMMGLPVTIRLLDISADKAAALFDSQKSTDGAAFLLSHPQLLRTQARAIAEASIFGPIRVLYPMVKDARQFIELRRIFREGAGEELFKRLHHGPMIERQSAVTDAEALLTEADFACLGTNDLTKDLLNINRDTAIVHDATILNAHKLWDAITTVATHATALGKELTVCGEMAGNIDTLARFTGINIRTFSMDIPKIRLLTKSNSSGFRQDQPESSPDESTFGNL